MPEYDLPEAVGWDRLRRPVWLFDNEAKRHIYANDAALTFWGAESREEFLARDCSDQSEAVATRTQRLLDDTANGEVIQQRWTFYPGGEPLAATVLVSTFVTPQGRATLMMEAEAIEVDSDQAMSLEAFRHSSALIALFDKNRRALFRNPAAFDAFGAGNLRLDERYHNPGAAAALIETAWAGSPVSEMLRAQTSQGDRWMHTAARKVVDPVTGQDCLLLCSQDVTAQVEAETSLAAAAERADHAEAREKALTDLSHEMRTPLNTILGFAELLRAETPGPTQVDRLDRISDAGRTLNDLVNEMIGEDVQASGGAVGSVAENAAPRPLRILYADDHENNRMIVSAMLASLGWSCVTVNDGAEALERMRANDYDLVLMDIQMPVMDGIDATRAIRSMGGAAAGVPILALTANTQSHQVQRYHAVGMQGCLHKPISMAELFQSITALTGSCGPLATEVTSTVRSA